MGKASISFVVNSCVLGFLILGVFYSNDNALNVALLFIWVWSITSVMAVAAAVKETLRGVYDFRIHMSAIFDVVTVCILAWDGSFFTASAVLIGSVCLLGAHAKAKD